MKVEIKRNGKTVQQLVTEAVIVIPISQSSRKIRFKEWVMTFQDFFVELAQDKELTLADRRVLEYLLGVMDLDNYVSVPQNEIAKKLGISERTVRRAIEKLRRKGILLKRKVGRFNAYMLNPEVAWKGSIKRYKEKLIEFNPGKR
mgnify:CR=1 FL=1